MKVFVTATDTEVGKTNYCANLASQLAGLNRRVAYFKPFQSGVYEDEMTDADFVRCFDKKVGAHTGYVTKLPCTPMLSAQAEGVEYDLKKIKKQFVALEENYDDILVEGSGGLLVPVKKGILMSDVIKMLALPVIIIARPNLGTINHTLMTIRCARQIGLKILGVVINNFPSYAKDPVLEQAKPMIEEFSGGVKVISTIEHSRDFKCKEDLLKGFEKELKKELNPAQKG